MVHVDDKGMYVFPWIILAHALITYSFNFVIIRALILIVCCFLSHVMCVFLSSCSNLITRQAHLVRREEKWFIRPCESCYFVYGTLLLEGFWYLFVFKLRISNHNVRKYSYPWCFSEMHGSWLLNVCTNDHRVNFPLMEITV